MRLSHSILLQRQAYTSARYKFIVLKLNFDFLLDATNLGFRVCLVHILHFLRIILDVIEQT